MSPVPPLLPLASARRIFTAGAISLVAPLPGSSVRNGGGLVADITAGLDEEWKTWRDVGHIRKKHRRSPSPSPERGPRVAARLSAIAQRGLPQQASSFKEERINFAAEIDSPPMSTGTCSSSLSMDSFSYRDTGSDRSGNTTNEGHIYRRAASPTSIRPLNGSDRLDMDKATKDCHMVGRNFARFMSSSRSLSENATPHEERRSSSDYVPSPPPRNISPAATASSASQEKNISEPTHPTRPSSSPLDPRADQQPSLDLINTLLRHPTLHDPVLKPRHPIVLLHGLYGFDVRGPAFFRLHYWGDLLKILRGKVGAEVFVTAVPGTGAIKQRAYALHRALCEMDQLKGRELNLVGHSMGGLDARFLLSQIRPTEYNPVSLTTLSTPHRGSEFMAWCRANIGIGTDFDKTSEEAARLAHEDTSIPLPYSLKAPILSRAQVEEARQADVKAKEAKEAANKAKAAASFPGLPYSLSASLSGYLLDVLDSPAYANLTPVFLREVFNPSTPDREDIKYYSVAARTDKIPIFHPLWLPKVVLDGAEAARIAKGNGPEPGSQGNDGLVNIESAKWGEFLGTIENCDHWEMRGSSGLVNAVESAKAIAESTEGETGKDSKKGKSWQWQDVYRLIGNSKGGKASETGSKDGAVVKVGGGGDSRNAEDAKGLAALASWISKRLPGLGSSSGDNKTSSGRKPLDGPASPTRIEQDKEGQTAESTSTAAQLSATLSASLPSLEILPAARMLYGAPTSSKKEKFNLEHMTLAICRKLYNDGM